MAQVAQAAQAVLVAQAVQEVVTIRVNLAVPAHLALQVVPVPLALQVVPVHLALRVVPEPLALPVVPVPRAHPAQMADITPVDLTGQVSFFTLIFLNDLSYSVYIECKYRESVFCIILYIIHLLTSIRVH